MRREVTIWLLALSLTAVAGDSFRGKLPMLSDDSLSGKSPVLSGDSLLVEQPEKEGWLKRLIVSFSEQDTAWVEPQHYNWALMLQSIMTYDYYKLSAGNQSVSFSPRLDIRMGPYFGWRWIFLGYTLDLRKLNIFKKSPRFEIDGSIYSARFGADVFYRRTVNDYMIRSVEMENGIDTGPLEGMSFDGLKVSITGISLYYIFNHKRFSYPAAFAQSSCQKISCGSWMAGLGYLSNSIDFDYERLESMARERLGQEVQIDSAMNFGSVKYRDISASVGYAYNWVFARNWLFCSSLSLALAYKKSYSAMEQERAHGFSFSNFNIDGIGRFGLVWNNTKWYAGASAIVRAYNYHKSRFAANNIFGDLSVYVGLNFGTRKEFKRKLGKR